MYIIEEYKLSDISVLQESWSINEKGTDMSYFQSYDWYFMLKDLCPEDCPYYISRLFAVVDENNITVLIAPLWIVLKSFDVVNRKSVFFLGRQGWSDYLNFIYSRFDNDSWECLAQYIYQKYGVRKWSIENLKENTEVYSYFTKKYPIRHNRIGICVGLSLPNSFDGYYKSLSKSVRQNIRTAFNRQKKEGIQVSFDFDDKFVDVNRCIELRDNRLKGKSEPFSFCGFLRRIGKDGREAISYYWSRFKGKIYNRYRYRFPSYNVLVQDKKAHFMTARIEGAIVAFFCYGISLSNKSIYVMSAGIDDKYKRYSPGMVLMYNYVLHLIDSKSNILYVDFTRGNESYKYNLGGQEHFIHSFDFIFKG